MSSQDLNRALFDAVEAGDTRRALALLEDGADPNAFPAHIWKAAIETGSIELVTALLHNGTEPNGAIPSLHWAAMTIANEPLLKLLLQHGADANALDGDRRTPLFCAVGAYGSVEAVAILLEAGADVHHVSDDGETALMYCAQQRNWWDLDSPLSALLKAGADPNAINQVYSQGVATTPLVAAAQNGHHSNVSCLLEYGADPNLPDIGGTTPLMAAAAEGHLVVVHLLREAGANLGPANEEGMTARALAKQHHRKLLKLL